MRLRFGNCVLDTGVRELRRGGEIVPLPPKAFRLLDVLVDRRPAAVSQDELRRLLWPDTVMGGTTIARLVSDLRTAIGDDDREAGAVIRTVHRFGYAFAAPTTEETATVSMRGARGHAVQWGSQLVPLAPGENVIGRDAHAFINVASPKVSRRHARILVEEERALIEDLSSRNGTYVNERRVTTRIDLRHGDRIGIGPALLIFYASDDDAATATQTRDT